MCWSFIWRISSLLLSYLITTFNGEVLISLTVKTFMVPFLLRNDQKLHTDNPVHNAPLKALETLKPRSSAFSLINSHTFMPMETYSINQVWNTWMYIIHKTILIFYTTYQEQIPLINQ